MNITAFKKWKKDKALNEYLVSGTSDLISPVVVVEYSKLDTDFKVVTNRNKTFCYIVKNIRDLQTNHQLQKMISSVHGYNFVGTFDKKLYFSYILQDERKVSEHEIVLFEAMKNKIKDNEHLREELSEKLSSEYPNLTSSELIQTERHSEYYQIIRENNRQYRSMLESFIEEFNYNPYDYVLVV